ncbi:hypothetical protein BH20VER2_BH20VER2_06250 [soil metagenome]
MKITIVLGAFLPVPPIMGGAVEKVWFAFAQEFARRGHEVVLLSRAVPEFPEREVRGGVQHIRVRGAATPRSLVQLKALDLLYSLRVRGALPRQSDIIVTNTFWLPMLLRNERRGKVCVHVARFPKGQMRWYSHCARLHAPSQSVTRAIISEAPALERKVVTIPYPRPARLAGEVVPFRTRPRTILYVGRIHPEKGVHLLLKAFGQVPPEIAANWKLRIVGPWEARFGGGGEAYYKELQSLAEAAGDAVQMPGPVFDPRALEQEYRDARLFVYPSLAERGETFGVAPLEAMTHGCAVLVSDLGCFHDFVAQDRTGFFFDHRTDAPAGTLAATLTALLPDEELLARVAEAGGVQSENYSLPKVAEKYLADFQLLTENQSS